jgi:hypothetical protein
MALVFFNAQLLAGGSSKETGHRDVASGDLGFCSGSRGDACEVNRLIGNWWLGV